MHEPQAELSGAFKFLGYFESLHLLPETRPISQVTQGFFSFTAPFQPLNRQHPVETFLSPVDGVVNERKSNWKKNERYETKIVTALSCSAVLRCRGGAGF